MNFTIEDIALDRSNGTPIVEQSRIANKVLNNPIADSQLDNAPIVVFMKMRVDDVVEVSQLNAVREL